MRPLKTVGIAFAFHTEHSGVLGQRKRKHVSPNGLRLRFVLSEHLLKISVDKLQKTNCDLRIVLRDLDDVTQLWALRACACGG